MRRERRLRRFKRTVVAACLVMAAIALVWSGGKPGPAIAMLAGGLLIGVANPQ